jgi:CheY-like chemotaxis protein
MAPERKEGKVLFVDDEEGIRNVMGITLADAGYQVLTDPDGETALALCRRDSKARPKRAVFRSSSPGHCIRPPGREKIRSRPCRRVPAYPYAPSPIAKRAPKEAS